MIKTLKDKETKKVFHRERSDKRPDNIQQVAYRKLRYLHTALQLAKFFGTSADLWLGLQKDYERDIAIDAVGENIERAVRTLASSG